MFIKTLFLHFYKAIIDAVSAECVYTAMNALIFYRGVKLQLTQQNQYTPLEN